MLYLYTLQLEKLEKKGYKLYMNQIKPMLLTTLKSYDRSQFVKDVTAGIIVAIIALPLSIALALASGVGPQAGIFTAIVAGFVISAFGGSSVQIAGPTAAFATIVAGIVAKDGLDGLVISTILAGIFLILMGLCHFGSLIKFIPYTITTGFTSGIAVTIVIGQLKDFFIPSYMSDIFCFFYIFFPNMTCYHFYMILAFCTFGYLWTFFTLISTAFIFSVSIPVCCTVS